MRPLLWILLFGFSGQAHAGILDDLASPVTTPAKIPLIVGAGITIGLVILEKKIDDPLQTDIASDKPLGKFSKVGNYGGQLIPNGAYALGMVTAGLLGLENAYEHAEIMFLGTAYAVGTSTLLKYVVREPRPYNAETKTSFPSGHATAAFAFASVVGAEHGVGWAIPAYALAALTGFSRINDNMHYLHDVTAGATIGIAYGLGIHYVRGKKSESPLAFAPVWEPEFKGILGTYSF